MSGPRHFCKKNRRDKSLKRFPVNRRKPSGFMEFVRFESSKILAREMGSSLRIRRLVIGNPLIMKEMVKHVPDAASYAPVTVLVVEGADSVRLSYDTMASLIASYSSAEASEVARELNEKVESLLIGIAH